MMRNRIFEQEDYRGRPERINPRSMAKTKRFFGTNPAFRRGEQDIERLMSDRFVDLVEKLSRATGIENLSSRQVVGVLMMDILTQTLPRIMRNESPHRGRLTQLAINVALDETEVDPNWFEIEATLGASPDAEGFNLGQMRQEIPSVSISMGLDDLTDDELLALEKHKRNIVNAMIQGMAKKGHYLFQKPEVKSQLDRLNPALYADYLKLMAFLDFQYFTMENLIELAEQNPNLGIAGKVTLQNNDDDEDGDESSDTKIVAQGIIFPILVHEIIKGIEEAKGRYWQTDVVIKQKVESEVDLFSNEPYQLRIGPKIVEKIRLALPDDLFEPENRGLINWFHIELYQLPADEFLEIIADVISTNPNDVSRAKRSFESLVRTAMVKKQEYENPGEEPDLDDDDFDLDELLR